MDSTNLNELTLTNDQIGEGCLRRALRVEATDRNTVTLTLDKRAPVSFSTEGLVSAQDLYDVFHFAAGAKYELTGLESYGQMDKSVYYDFFALILEIVNGLNALNPGSIVQVEQKGEGASE